MAVNLEQYELQLRELNALYEADPNDVEVLELIGAVKEEIAALRGSGGSDGVVSRGRRASRWGERVKGGVGLEEVPGEDTSGQTEHGGRGDIDDGSKDGVDVGREVSDSGGSNQIASGVSASPTAVRLELVKAGVDKKRKKTRAGGAAKELESRKSSWQAFASKNKSLASKKSMFASPEEGTIGRVGFHGSKNTLTANPERKRWV
uniref:Uncharacterized protein n=1 Tax=Compsopogon caeruleus TaxID=31354 RepID=A0A7S1TI56_9RHOD|mmetsp:Transcript_8880/g.17915  ORF Transcript_8880/g.17915 Transcript_8880/m.17915 type:complete len:205 (+) Transcript_8880:126-740(+)